MSTRKATKLTNQRLNPRLRLALALGVALLLGAAEQVQAQTTVTKTTTKNQSFAQQVFNTCTGENVDVQGTEDTTFQSQQQQSPSQFQSKFQDRLQGTGVAQITNAQYKFSDFTNNMFKSSMGTFTVRFTRREHLFRDGNTFKKDDFFLRIRSRINFTNGDPNGPTIESFETEQCK
jgi:hypothetical protein